MKTKSILISLTVSGILMTVTSCKAPQQLEKATGAVEISVPFSDSKYKTDKDFFRSTASGNSPSLEDARSIALLNAKNRLAGVVKTVLSSARRQFTQTMNAGGGKEFESKDSNQTWAFVDQALYSISSIDEKIFKETDNSYTCWVVVEMSTKSILDGVNKEISNDKKLEVNYDQKKFAEDVEKEKAKMAKEQ